MKHITLGKTGITVPQNAFGALPIQRVDNETAVKLLRRAREGGMCFFDTARGYTEAKKSSALPSAEAGTAFILPPKPRPRRRRASGATSKPLCVC